jgi:hypothetical protein
MKKLRITLFIFFLGVAFNGLSQTTSTSTTLTTTTSAKDFFAGKWEITVMGTPNGDSKFLTNLVRKDGKLTGELATPDPAQPKIPITKIEESADKLVIYFTAQNYDIDLNMTKVDDNNLKGTMMNMFEAKGLRGNQ